MGRGWKNFEILLKKNNQILNVILVRGQEEKRGALEKASFLQNTNYIYNV